MLATIREALTVGRTGGQISDNVRLKILYCFSDIHAVKYKGCVV